MCGSEPCRHERADASEFAGTQLDTLTSFIKTSGELVKVTAERNAALKALARVRALHVTNARWCVADAADWPCPTIRALKEPS